MKIVFDHQIFCMQQYGGISRYFCEISNILFQLGHHVEIRAPLHLTHYSFNTETIKGYKVPRLPKLFLLTQYANKLLSSIIWPRNSKADIYHETYFTPYDNCPRSAFRFITLYDMIHEKFPDFVPPHDRTGDVKKKALLRADHIISISHNTQRDLIDIFNIDPNKISVVHLGISTPPVNPSCSIPSKKPYLLFVGERQGYKNFKRFLNAYAASLPLKKECDVLCFGGRAFDNEEIDLIKKNNLSNKIRHLTGNDRHLANLYCHAAAMIYPTLYEGFGLPPLEAMSYDCPVVCSHTSAIPEVVGNAACFFDPYSIESIRASIERVIFDSSYREALISIGKKQVQLYSWEKCAHDTLHVYKKIAQNG